MLPSHRSLPLPYHIFNLAGRQLEKFGIHMGGLGAETLYRTAKNLTRRSDFGNPYFQAGLEKLLDSLKNDAHLRFYGRLVMRFVLTNYLCQRLLFVDAQKKHPDTFEPLKQHPIVVTGLHRSGTTFLHRLLSLDPMNAGPLFWELYRPFQSPGILDLRKLQAWTELQLLSPVFPGLKQKHRIHPFFPEESSWMMGLTFQSMVFWILAPVYSYLNWLWKQDFSEVYREYAWLLYSFQNAYPHQRLVVKAPDHMPHLDLLLAEIPGARIVQLHREPATCCLSLSSLFYSTHIALSEEVCPRQIAESNKEMMVYFLRANRHARGDLAVDQMVLDVNYEDLVVDPIRTVKAIYKHYNLSFSEDYAASLFGFLKQSKERGQPAHHYSGDQFGLSEAEVQCFFKDS